MRAFGLIFLATLLARLSSLISFPITARTLSVAELGQLTMWHTLRGLILLACCLGLPDVIARRTASEDHRGPLLTALRLSGIVLVVVACVGELLVRQGFWGQAIAHPGLLWVAAALDLLPALFVAALPASGRIRAYATVVVLPAVLVATLSAVLVSPPFSMGLVGPLYAHVTASIMTSGLCAMHVLRLPPTPPAGTPTVPDLLRESLPIMGIALVGMALTTIDRYSINWSVGPEGVGFYAVAFQVAALLSFGGGAVRSSISQRIIRDAQSDAAALSRMANQYLCCGAWFVTLLCAAAPEIIALLAGPRFARYAEVVIPLGGAVLLLELFSLGQAIAVAQGRASSAFRSIALGSVVALAGVPALTQALGIMGTALGLAVAYAVACLTILRGRQLAIRPNWELGLILILGSSLGWLYTGHDWAQHAQTSAGRLTLAALAVVLGVRHLHALSKDKVPQ